MRDGPRGFGQDFSCPGLLRCRLCPVPVFAYGAVTRCGPAFQRLRLTFSGPFSDGPTTPVGAETPPVWALARSLATTGAIIGLFSFPPGTEMFQFPGLASLQRGCRISPAGCPIRTSADRWVFAPTRGFSQLVTSFVASESLGILHVPFSPFFLTLVRHRSNFITPRPGIPRRCAASFDSITLLFIFRFTRCVCVRSF